ncbi:MAG: sulfite exporter TauE/SafE family protein [Acidobacteriaceae bacterium]
MEYLIGFVIATFIALTGVGAGTITVPLLILFLHVPAAIAVTVGLMYSAVVKLVLAPAQVMRRNVNWRVLGFMLAGGVPGVLIGSLVLKHFVDVGAERGVEGALGLILVFTATYQIIFSFRSPDARREHPDKPQILPWLMLPVGAEVGFSSAGAGALGSAALLSLTRLTPAQVVGTDIAFGFLISLIGSGAHWFTHAMNTELLLHLVEGGAFGAALGTMLSTKVPKRPLKFALWIWLLLIGGMFLYRFV